MSVLATRHIGIIVSDMGAALRFYRDYLGLPVERSFPSRSGDYMSALTGLADADLAIELLRAPDGSLIELLQIRSHPAPRGKPAAMADVGRSHVAFTVADLDDLYRRRDAFSVAFNSAPLDSPDGVRVCFCRDPDGTMVELVQPGRAR